MLPLMIAVMEMEMVMEAMMEMAMVMMQCCHW